MGLSRKNILLYAFIVIIPTTLAILLYSYISEKKETEEIRLHLNKTGQIHQEYLETFVNETAKSLDILGLTTLNTSGENKDAITNLLIKAKKTDQRYGDLFLTDANGMIMTGSTSRDNGKQLDGELIKECKALKKTIISNEKEYWLQNKKKIFYICKPLTGSDGQIESFLFLHLRLDSIENVLGMLTPYAAVTVKNAKGKELLSINDDLEKSSVKAVLPFDTVPWTLTVSHVKVKDGTERNSLLIFSVAALFFMHIVFITLKYLMLKKEAKRQKKEYNEQKLKMIGTLAATTAHEIRNPLTGIKGLVQLLGEKHVDSQDQMYFSIIEKEIARINEIVNEFLILGKPSVYPLERFDIRDVFFEILPILQTEAASHDVTFHISIGNEPLPVYCLPDQLKQVILNIVKNSFEACSPLDEISIHLQARDNEAVLLIEDNGSGMSKTTLSKIFDPFYTTKDYGTGLGLYICKRIITSYKGSIFISSQKNKGTAVEITLPLNKTSHEEGNEE